MHCATDVYVLIVSFLADFSSANHIAGFQLTCSQLLPKKPLAPWEWLTRSTGGVWSYSDSFCICGNPLAEIRRGNKFFDRFLCGVSSELFPRIFWKFPPFRCTVKGWRIHIWIWQLMFWRFAKTWGIISSEKTVVAIKLYFYKKIRHQANLALVNCTKPGWIVWSDASPQESLTYIRCGNFQMVILQEHKIQSGHVLWIWTTSCMFIPQM